MPEPRRIRIEWVGADEIPQVLRECAETEVQALRDVCQQMTAMKIERRQPAGADECRLSCLCRDRQLCIRVTRSTLGEALQAFERALRIRCAP